MAGEKRKRHDGPSQEMPRKKQSTYGSSDNIRVSMIEDIGSWMPLLVSSPGLVIPRNLRLKPYTKAQQHNSRSPDVRSELLLHSSDHPRLEYVAREEGCNDSEAHIQNYIGIYDPETKELQVVPAGKTTLRSTLRSMDLAERQAKGNETQEGTPNKLSARSNLGLAFGTKKSQKAIRALTANAIQASPSKSATHDSPEKRSQLDPLASAVISSMVDATSSMHSREEMQAAIDEGKPRPKPNLQASNPAEVYPIERLVGGASTLGSMGVKDWIDKINEGKDVQLKSRFIARKLRATVQSGDVKKLKVMKYLLLLIEWFMVLKPAKSGRKVPRVEEMGPLVEIHGSDVVVGVARRFADGFQLNKWHMDHFITHVLAIAITLDNLTIDTHDIREDLKLEQKDISKYYAELGCAIARPTETERSVLGITKAEASSHAIARLKLPLTFPKTRVVPGKKRR